MRIAFQHARFAALLLLFAAPARSAAVASGIAPRSVVARDVTRDERPGAGFLREEASGSTSAGDSLSARPQPRLAPSAPLRYDEDHTTLRRATRITLVSVVALAGVAAVWGTIRLMQDMIQ